jgi:hypothetical protein
VPTVTGNVGSAARRRAVAIALLVLVALSVLYALWTFLAPIG